MDSNHRLQVSLPLLWICFVTLKNVSVRAECQGHKCSELGFTEGQQGVWTVNQQTEISVKVMEVEGSAAGGVSPTNTQSRGGKDTGVIWGRLWKRQSGAGGRGEQGQDARQRWSSQCVATHKQFLTPSTRPGEVNQSGCSLACKHIWRVKVPRFFTAVTLPRRAHKHTHCR